MFLRPALNVFLVGLLATGGYKGGFVLCGPGLTLQLRVSLVAPHLVWLLLQSTLIEIEFVSPQGAN